MKLSILCITAAIIPHVCVAENPKPPVGVPSDAAYFNGRFYKVIMEKLPWHSAKAKAERSGGRLAVIPNAAAWDFAVKLAAGASLWLGASDEQTEGSWKWIDGSPLEFSAWLKDNPSNTGGTEHYLATYQRTWNDVPKNGKFGNFEVSGFLCEWVIKQTATR